MVENQKALAGTRDLMLLLTLTDGPPVVATVAWCRRLAGETLAVRKVMSVDR